MGADTLQQVPTSSHELRQVPTSCDKFRQAATSSDKLRQWPNSDPKIPKFWLQNHLIPSDLRSQIWNSIFSNFPCRSHQIYFFSVLRGPKLIGNVVPEYRHVLWSMDKYRQSMDKRRRVQTRTDTDRTLIHKLSKFSSKTTYPSPSNHQINISRKINVRAIFSFPSHRTNFYDIRWV